MRHKKIIYKPIGIIHSPHKEIKGVPIQPSSAKGIQGEIELFEEYQDGLKDLNGFSHIIILYDFHKSKGYSLQIKPFLDEKLRGVFATRAPKRPNQIGLSVLKLNGIKANKLYVENVDMLDETPVLDIKPYASPFDAVEEEKIGWLSKNIKESDVKKSDERFK
jgi:tRNA-Thr(GGU) m(6)t(6)A37 methyltransferase TsaA